VLTLYGYDDPIAHSEHWVSHLRDPGSMNACSSSQKRISTQVPLASGRFVAPFKKKTLFNVLQQTLLGREVCKMFEGYGTFNGRVVRVRDGLFLVKGQCQNRCAGFVRGGPTGSGQSGRPKGTVCRLTKRILVPPTGVCSSLWTLTWVEGESEGRR
jgi:hypothetical protein